MNAMQYSIYKGTGGKFGALQFRFQGPHFYKDKEKDYAGTKCFEMKDGKQTLKEGWEAREGAIFMEITSAKDKNVYDWENKVVMALSTNDMGKLLLTLATGNECNLMHDPGAKSEAAGAVKKFMNVTSPKGTAEGVLFCVSQSAGGQTRKHMVPLAGDEVMVLRQLLQSAVSKSLGW